MPTSENPLLGRFKNQIDTSRPNPISPEVISAYQQKAYETVIEPYNVPGMGSYRLHDVTGPMHMRPYVTYAFFPEQVDYVSMIVGLSKSRIPAIELDTQTILIRMLQASLPTRIKNREIPVTEDDVQSLAHFEGLCTEKMAPSLMLALTWNDQYSVVPILYTLQGMSPETGLSVVQYAARQSLERIRE